MLKLVKEYCGNVSFCAHLFVPVYFMYYLLLVTVGIRARRASCVTLKGFPNPTFTWSHRGMHTNQRGKAGPARGSQWKPCLGWMKKTRPLGFELESLCAFISPLQNN